MNRKSAPFENDEQICISNLFWIEIPYEQGGQVRSRVREVDLVLIKTIIVIQFHNYSRDLKSNVPDTQLCSEQI